MTLAQVASFGALSLGIGAVGLCAVGLFRARDVFDRLHFGGPANVLGPIGLTVALGLILGWTSAITVRGALIGLILATTGPIAAHALARAARLRTRETLDVLPDDAGTPR